MQLDLRVNYASMKPFPSGWLTINRIELNNETRKTFVTIVILSVEERTFLVSLVFRGTVSDRQGVICNAVRQLIRVCW